MKNYLVDDVIKLLNTPQSGEANNIVLRQMLQQRATLPDGIHEMTLDNLEQMKEMMASCFLEKNQVWSSFSIDRSDILDFFDRLIRGHVASQERTKQAYGNNICHSMVFVMNGRIISFIMHYQLEDYRILQKEEKPEKLELFRELEKEGKELAKYVDMNQYPPGKALYANFGGVHPSFDIPSLHKLILFIQYHQRCRDSGFRWIVGRVSNVKAMELYKKIGAKVLKEVTFERKGKQFRLFFFDFDLHGETFNFCLDNLDALKEKFRERNMLKNSKL